MKPMMLFVSVSKTTLDNSVEVIPETYIILYDNKGIIHVLVRILSKQFSQHLSTNFYIL